MEALNQEYPTPFGAGPVVYYARIGGLIKIGHTQSFHSRMVALRVDDVLAIEPGSFQQERARHRQFAEEHAKSVDWFHPSPRLLAHAAGLVATYGPVPEWRPRWTWKRRGDLHR